MTFPEAPSPRYSGQAVWRYNLPRPAEVNKLAIRTRAPRARPVWCPRRLLMMYLLLIETPGGDTPPTLDADTLAEQLRSRLMPFGGVISEVRELITDSSRVVYRPIETVWVEPPGMPLRRSATRRTRPRRMWARGRRWRWRIRSCSPRSSP